MSKFLSRIEGLKKSAEEGQLTDKQKEAFEGAKDAIAHFAAWVEEIEKHR